MTPFPYAMAAIDIDDTLVGPDKKIGEQNRKAVKRLQDLGCRVILASGRRHSNMLPYCDELGLNDFIVSCQGARVEHARKGQRLRLAALPRSATSSLVAEGISRGFTVMLWLTEGVFAQAHTSWVDVYHEESGDVVTITDLDALLDHPAEKVIWASDPARLLAVEPEIKERHEGRLSVLITNDWYLEMTALDAHKADAVAAVAAAAGIPREAVLAFGDGNNDVTMLSWAGCGVAMPHGRASAKAAARLVAPDGDPEAALARAVSQLTAGYAALPRATERLLA
jgi:Cof subfamily protein (haloacid dehalogenase superfamily)